MEMQFGSMVENDTIPTLSFNLYLIKGANLNIKKFPI